jgi:cytochrome P450
MFRRMVSLLRSIVSKKTVPSSSTAVEQDLTKDPPGPVNINAAVGLTWRHFFCLWWNPLGFIEYLAREFGGLVFYRIFWFRVYQVNDPELIREVLVNKAKVFLKDQGQIGFIRDTAGEGIITTEGEPWLQRRRMLLPAFQSRYAQRMADVAVEETHRMVADWQGRSDVPAYAEFTRLMVQISGRAMFGLEDREEVDALCEAFADINSTVSSEAVWRWRLPEFLPTAHNRRKQKARAAIHQFVDAQITKRRATGELGDDLLSRLLAASQSQASGAALTDSELRDEAFTMFFAAHHTLAATLAWTFYLLSCNPEHRCQLVDEVDATLQGKAPTLADLPSLPYTEMVIKESMRIFPPAWMLFARQATSDVELGGYTIPAKSWVFIYPWVVHRDPHVYADPLKFDPLRFSTEREGEIPTGAYIPFGLGPHTCIGNRIGMLVLQHILPIVLQQFELEWDDEKGSPVPVPQISVRPKCELRMRLVRRQNAAVVEQQRSAQEVL